jgi:hypothetical protein
LEDLLVKHLLGVLFLTTAAIPGWAGVIDFSAPFPGGNPATYQGITFTNNGSGSGGPGLSTATDWSAYFGNIPGASLGNALNDSWGITNLTIDFGGPVNGFSILLSTGVATSWTVTAYDAGNAVLGSTFVTMPGAQLAVLASLNFNGINKVTIVEPSENHQITLFDDLTFNTAGVPEPSTLGLAGLGLALAAWKMRRR